MVRDDRFGGFRRPVDCQVSEIQLAFEIVVRPARIGAGIRPRRPLRLRGAAPAPDLTRGKEIMDRIAHYDREVTIGVVGKYVGLPDAYKRLREALVHGGIANRTKSALTGRRGLVQPKTSA